MKGWRNSADLAVRCGGRKVGVAFQAYQALLVTHQHSRVRGSVRFMTGRATFQAHRRMLEDEWAAFIAVAFQASRLIAERRSHAVGGKGGVWIVAIHAGHRSFRKSMLIGPVERRPLRYMTRGTARVDFLILVFHQLGAAASMDEVAGGASDLILGVPACDTPTRSLLIQVAGKASAVHIGGGELGWIPDVAGRSGFGVFGAWAVAGFAALLRPALARAGLDGKMRSLLKVVKDFFVTGLASVGTGVARGFGARGGNREPPQETDQRDGWLAPHDL